VVDPVPKAHSHPTPKKAERNIFLHHRNSFTKQPLEVLRDDRGKIMGSKSSAQQFQRLLMQLRIVGPRHNASCQQGVLEVLRALNMTITRYPLQKPQKVLL
jgi:hypothetical protein